MKNFLWIVWLVFAVVMLYTVLTHSSSPFAFFHTPQVLHPPLETPVVPLPPMVMNAERLIWQAQMRYATLDTYRDEGVVEILFEMERWSPDYVSYQEFATSYVRDDAFRFEYWDMDHPINGGYFSERHYVIWKKDGVTRRWWTLRPQIKEVPSLRRALTGAAGVSNARSTTVPDMLMPNMRRSRPFGLTEPVLTGLQKVDGVWCYRIDDFSRHWCFVQRTVWIDHETLLLRRAQSVQSFEDFSAISTSVYDSEANPTIDSSAFDFQPPDRLTRRSGR